MNFGQYMNKRLRITFTDGDVYEGVGKDYSSALDNPDGIATICVGDFYEFKEDEIASIQVITASAPIMASAI